MRSNDIFVKYGNTPKSMVMELLDHIRIENEIDKNASIGIKPNLVVAKPSNTGATTCPEIVAGIIEYLQSKGYSRIKILEGSWVGDRTSKAFKVCGYEELAQRYNVSLIDLQRDSFRAYDVEGIKLNICDKVMGIDYLINVPVLKGHCQTNMTCALKNMKGCIPDSEKRRFHTMGLHRPIAYLNKVIKQNLIIVDGIMGDLNFEEGGNPVHMDRILAGKDPVLVDAYVAQLMGYSVHEVPYIQIADSIGVGCSDVNKAAITELNKTDNTKQFPLSGRAQQLSKFIEECKACSACFGSLIHALDRLDERGRLNCPDFKIHIGQGYKGKQSNGIGIGMCTKGFEHSVSGCPPKSKDIIDFLNKVLS